MAPRVLLFVASAAFLAVASAQLGPYTGGRPRFSFGNTNREVDYIYRPVGGRGTNPFAGVLPGLACLVGSSALLWWNEGRAVRQEKMLRDALRKVTSIDGSVPPPAELEGELVHVSGEVESGGVADPLWPVQRPGAARLRRKSEVYQWSEREHTHERRVSSTHVRRERSYSYSLGWETRAHHSANFREAAGHHNPPARVEPGVATHAAADARLAGGGVALPPDLVSQLGGWTPVATLPPLGAADGAAIAPLPDGSAQSVYLPPAGKLLPGVEAPARRMPDQLDLPAEVERHVRDASGGGDGDGVGTMARLARPPAPRPGDARVSWEEVRFPAEGVSALGVLRGGAIRPWLRPRGRSLARLARGAVPAEEMIDEARGESRRRTWWLRAAGCGLSALGLSLLLSFLPAIAAYVPLLGGFASSLVGAGVGVAAVGIALSSSVFLIAVAWVRFRPLFGAGLGVIALAAMAAQARVVQAMQAAPLR